MSNERSEMVSRTDAAVVRGAGLIETALLNGVYTANCVRAKRGRFGAYEPLWLRRGDLENRIIARGGIALQDEKLEIDELDREMALLSEEVWADIARNTVCTEGKNLALDTFLAGSSYTVVGPFLGLISSVGWSATAAGDTAAQIQGTNGWKEAGDATNLPQWTTPASSARRTTASGWSSASSGSKALSSALSFSISADGTVKGCFLIYGTGAVATHADTNGKLMSAGVFSGGDKVVQSGDTLNVSYSVSF